MCMWQLPHMCRREVPRCEKCVQGHETKACVALEKVVVCVNCRDTHGAGDQKCPRERQVEVSRVRVLQKLSMLRQ